MRSAHNSCLAFELRCAPSSIIQAVHRNPDILTLKKIIQTPDFPSKRNPRTKPLEQRRQELEDYIQFSEIWGEPLAGLPCLPPLPWVRGFSYASFQPPAVTHSRETTEVIGSLYYGLTVWFPDMIKYLQKQEYE
ncbi:sorting nexin-22 [Lates japonicus]|uniref:Sorting nexin-22 n=1 Tax=Lates japonicus TaxID=270547 RepID=A0AAD3N769_LATJO|nr:sorting nexin-22 [Lates japonicus]